MMHKYFALLLIITHFSIHAQTEKEFNLSEIIVKSGRVSVSSSEINKTIEVITKEELKELPAADLLDLLKFVSSVDLRSRGVEGVQADVSIRGGNFEQTLIMIDGVRITDSQTGHHNLNIPLTAENIERIEIIKGEGSRAFGANAFSGSINFITNKEKKTSLAFSLLGGQNSLYETSITASAPLSISANSFSFSKKKSDGYRHNTAFDITNFSFNHSLSFQKAVINIFAGYTDKKFGANSFYSDRFPNQWEHTKTLITHLTSEFEFSSFSFSPKFYWRRNDDDYRLDNTRPEWYRNIHKSNSYGFEMQSSLKTKYGTTSFGGEIGRDEIISSNLGDHSRNKSGFFVEQLLEPIKKLNISVGAFAYNYSNIGWKYWPGIDAGVQATESIRIFASVGRAFRIPTFTELYYISPANIGNPSLSYEHTTNYEFGSLYANTFINTRISFFLREGKNIIDWVRLNSSAPWEVENVTSIQTKGFEFGFSFIPKLLLVDLPFTKFEVNYTFLSPNRRTGLFESRYLLDHLKHQVLINASNNLPFSIKQNWIYRIEQRENLTTNFIINTRLAKTIKYFELYFMISNLFNSKQADFSGIPLPGRLLSAGVKFKISDQ